MDRDAGAAVRGRIDLNRATVHLDDAAADVQAETHARHAGEVLAGMRLVEAVEDVRSVFRRNPDTVVAYDELHRRGVRACQLDVLQDVSAEPRMPT